MLALADAGAATVAVTSFAYLGDDTAALAWALAAVPAWVLLAKLHGLYDRDHQALRHLTADELPRLLMWSLTATGATVMLLLLATPVGALEPETAAGAWLVGAAAAFTLRSAARWSWRRLVPPERTVILGAGPLADAARRKVELFPDMHLSLVPTVDVEPERRLRLVEAGAADRVILAASAIEEDFLSDLLEACRRSGAKLSVVPPARGAFGTAVGLGHVADLPVVEYNTWDASRSTLFLKRTMDLALAGPALILLAPLLALAAVAVRLETPGPALFRQRRAGLKGRPFTMLKFRTMLPDAEDRLAELVALDGLADPVFKLVRDPRVTRVGRTMRRWSIDELPQLWNVLKGEMSLVGPRPEQVELVARYEPEHRFRLAVRPGMTGPMQVYGRGDLTFEERLAVDREYIENFSLTRDLRILAATIATVARGGGAY